MPPAHELSGELKKLHDDFGYTSETMSQGSSIKATMAREFIPLFKPLADTMRAGTAAMGSPEVIQRSENCVSRAQSRLDLVHSLRAEAEAVFHPIGSAFIRTLAEDTATCPRLVQAGHTAAKLVREMKERMKLPDHIDNKEAIALLCGIIKFGITNVAHQIWTLFEVIPHAHKEDSRTLDPRRNELLAESTYSILTQLAACHDRVFHVMMLFLHHGNSGPDPSQWPVLAPLEFQTLHDAMIIRPDLFLFVRRKLEMLREEGKLDAEQPYVGCVGSFLFRPVFDGCLNAARTTLFANPEKVAELT